MTSDSKPPQRLSSRLRPVSDRQGRQGQPRQGQSPASRQGSERSARDDAPPRPAPRVLDTEAAFRQPAQDGFRGHDGGHEGRHQGNPRHHTGHSRRSAAQESDAPPAGQTTSARFQRQGDTQHGSGARRRDESGASPRRSDDRFEKTGRHGRRPDGFKGEHRGHGQGQSGKHAGKPRHAPSSSIQPLNPKKLSGDEVLDFFCPCPRGLEQVLADELKTLGATAVEITHGGVACQGKLQLAYRINLEARLPSRVMLRLIEAPCPHEHALYRLCHSIGWENWFSAQHTLRVDVVAIRSPLKSLNFATLRIKDAIVDHFRERGGVRPSIDTRNPDVRIHAFLNADRLQLYLDLSGEPLFKRGWRSSQDRHVSAPLKENLAAGLLALSGWQPGQPLGDLFCGSGTIIIEAAQQLCKRAPGLDRRFGIEQLSIHQPALFDELLSRLRERARQGIEAAPKNLLWASDLDADAIELARDNLALAGLPEDIVQFQVADAATVLPLVSCQKGIIVSNPPYNERVEIPIEHWRDIGRNLRDNFGGWHVFLLTSDRGLPGQLGLRERHKAPLFNGAIECRLFDFEMRVRGEPTSRNGHNG